MTMRGQTQRITEPGGVRRQVTHTPGHKHFEMSLAGVQILCGKPPPGPGQKNDQNTSLMIGPRPWRALGPWDPQDPTGPFFVFFCGGPGVLRGPQGLPGTPGIIF